MKKTLVILSCLIAQGIFLSPSAHANPECPGTNLCIANTIDGGGGGTGSSNRFVGVVFLSLKVAP